MKSPTKRGKSVSRPGSAPAADIHSRCVAPALFVDFLRDDEYDEDGILARSRRFEMIKVPSRCRRDSCPPHVPESGFFFAEEANSRCPAQVGSAQDEEAAMPSHYAIEARHPTTRSTPR